MQNVVWHEDACNYVNDVSANACEFNSLLLDCEFCRQVFEGNEL